VCGGDFPHGPSQSGSKRQSALVERPAHHPRTSANPMSTNIPPPIGPMIPYPSPRSPANRGRRSASGSTPNGPDPPDTARMGAAEVPQKRWGVRPPSERQPAAQ